MRSTTNPITRRSLAVATIATAVAATALLLSVLVAPASADPPVIIERTIDPIGLDFDNGYVVFFNHTRDVNCAYWGDWEQAMDDWITGGFIGPEPEPPPPSDLGMDSVTIQRPPDGGVTLGRASDMYVEIWSFDSELSASGIWPCLDTNDDATLVATGYGEWMFHSSNVVNDPTRATAVSVSMMADMVGVDGSSFSYNYRLRFNSRCHRPEGQPPVCFDETGRILYR